MVKTALIQQQSVNCLNSDLKPQDDMSFGSIIKITILNSLVLFKSLMRYGYQVMQF